MRCLTITLNAAIDTTYTLERFRVGETQRVGRKVMAPGGKGNNVARVLATLGHTVVASGFVAGPAGAFIAQGVRERGIEAAFLNVPGESRTCLAIREEESGAITELLERGVTIAPQDADCLLAHVRALASGMDAVVVSGSLPDGLPTDYYARLLGMLRPLPCLLVFDSSGDALRAGMAAGPDVIKPNAAEIAMLVGDARSLEGTVTLARERLLGPVLANDATILLSCGARGAALITRSATFVATPPPVPVVNSVGAGDAMVAGYLDARAAGADGAAALVEAVAVGTAAVLQETAGVVDMADIARIRASVHVAPLVAR